MAFTIGWLLGQLAVSAAASLLSSSLLWLLCKWVIGSRPAFSRLYSATLLSYVIAVIAGYVIGWQIGQAGYEVSGGVFLLVMLMGFGIQVLLYTVMLSRMDGSSIGVARAALLTLMQLAIGGIVLVLLTGVSSDDSSTADAVPPARSVAQPQAAPPPQSAAPVMPADAASGGLLDIVESVYPHPDARRIYSDRNFWYWANNGPEENKKLAHSRKASDVAIALQRYKATRGIPSRSKQGHEFAARRYSLADARRILVAQTDSEVDRILGSAVYSSPPNGAGFDDMIYDPADRSWKDIVVVFDRPLSETPRNVVAVRLR